MVILNQTQVLAKKHRPLTCFHWNVNSVIAHKMLKKSLIEAYNTSHKYDFTCISETYLDSTVAADDKDLAIEGYNLVHAVHPNDLKKGGVYIYYNESLAIQLINVNYLSECLLCQITFDNTKGYLQYRSPSQTSSAFNYFLLNSKKMLQEISAFKPDFSITLGDFNARSKSWSKSDTDTIEGTKIDAVTCSYGLQQLIPQPTHLLANSSSCIDLIFTDQPSLVVDCGTHPSLHPNCHHQIMYCKLDLKLAYPPPYQRHVWDFKRANIDLIRKAVKMVDWHFMFMNKTVHEQVTVFNTILINIFSNYIPNKYIIIDDIDPPWMTKAIKDKINAKKSLCKSKKFIELQNLAIDISEMISIRKNEYYDHLSKKLNNPNTSAKSYWSILKSFYKGSKVPLIPPLLVNNKTVFVIFLLPSAHQSVITVSYLQENLLRLIKGYTNSMLRKMIFLK